MSWQEQRNFTLLHLKLRVRHIGDALIELGFDVVNLANNHMLDMDNKGTGLYNTIQYWNNKDILH